MKDPRKSRIGTKRRTIADYCMAGKTKREVYSLLAPLVQDGRMVFSANIGGQRRPKAMHDQLQDLQNEIGRIYSYLGRSKGSKFEDEEISSDDFSDLEDDSDDSDEETEEDEETETKTHRATAKGKRNLKEEWAYFVRRIREIRRFCIERERMSEHVDWISIRPMQAGAALIAAGIPADVLLLSMAMHWSPDTRRDAGIDDFDFSTEGSFKPHPGMLEVSERVMREREISPDGKHVLFGYVLLLVENRVPVMLIGPPGTGKSHIAEQVADFLDLKYGETPMSSGASRSDLLGRHTINAEKPFIPAEHTERYSAGGVFNFEEIDRSDPSVLIVMHNALARKTLYNSISGETHTKSADYAAVSTANSFGLGANRQTTTGERLDSATLDRFRMGRVYLPIDERMEEEIFTAEFHASLK